MSDLVAEFLKSSNFVQLIAIGIMFWFFYNRLDAKISTSKTEMKVACVDMKQEMKDVRQEIKDVRQEIKDVRQEIKHLGEKVEDVDRRLCRIEGSLASQGHCLFGQRETRKAE